MVTRCILYPAFFSATALQGGCRRRQHLRRLSNHLLTLATHLRRHPYLRFHRPNLTTSRHPILHFHRPSLTISLTCAPPPEICAATLTSTPRHPDLRSHPNLHDQHPNLTITP